MIAVELFKIKQAFDLAFERWEMPIRIDPVDRGWNGCQVG